MEKRKLGNTDLFVSKVGLGCMSLGTDEKKAREIIAYALDSGINFFDTADLYDYGINEKIVGKALKDVRDRVIIATKVGNRWNKNKDGWFWGPSKTYIKEAVKNSLQRLGIDYIDLYQLHGGTLEDPMDEIIQAFEELKEEGMIRHYGISSIRPNVIQQYAEKSKIVSVMMQYNMFDRRPEEQAIPLLVEKGISLLARGPLAKGLLTDRFFEKVSEGIKKNGYINYRYEELEAIYHRLKETFGPNRSMTEVSLQFVLANPAIASVVVGASSVEQLIENVKASKTKPLTDKELEQILSVTKKNTYEKHRI
ncbi:aldo/keto reductase [Fervidibacillus halotolerans]|uniref:Aldo/keto reductase n=1 Tax=Fervidibacillus halotolerans TaxID=2980027 RepID=A0A9E8M1S7_9BACI|nr:aldo/keto reductase [Fervidibacillus halotolerans]WAA13827.1 aldo/keto reductase [Fervidibacillus halotolerans]